MPHRRRSHRFPVAVHAAYSTDGDAPPPRAATSRTSAATAPADDGLEERGTPGERLRLVLLLDEGPVEVTGTVAAPAPTPTRRGWIVGVDFDDARAGGADAIVAWCFRHPFGPERAVCVADLEGDRRLPAVPAPATEPQPSRA